MFRPIKSYLMKRFLERLQNLILYIRKLIKLKMIDYFIKEFLGLEMSVL
jgi:hypothetical protein